MRWRARRLPTRAWLWSVVCGCRSWMPRREWPRATAPSGCRAGSVCPDTATGSCIRTRRGGGARSGASTS
uniref:Putative secreted protein n=1 Tax=Ixodes ricinus TaxID=34613 RepID=A0A6B0U297_IXORI